MNDIITNCGLAIVVAVCSLIYALKLLVKKDATVLRQQNGKPLRDEAGYCKAMGILMLAFTFTTAVMAVLLMVNYLAALIEGIVTMAAACVLWLRINRAYE